MNKRALGIAQKGLICFSYVYTPNRYHLIKNSAIISSIMDPQQQQPQPSPQQQPQSQQPSPGLYPNRPVPPPPPPQEYPSASQMKGSRSKGLLISVIVLAVLFAGVSGFAIWAFMGRQEFKENVDGIVTREVSEAVSATEEQKETEFIEREKEPFTSYTSPAAVGGVTIEYPKTWSAYIKEADKGNKPIEGYFHPHFVPDEGGDTLIALKIEVVDTPYTQTLRQFDGAARSGRVTVKPIEAKNVQGVIGSRVDGEVSKDTQGSIVLFELRDKTLILTTESTEFKDDFNNIILANLRFNP